MSVKAIADDLVALCRAGRNDEASAKYHDEDIVSIEAMGPPGTETAARGKAAVEAKSKWWADNHEVTNAEVDGPYVNGDQFAVRYSMQVKVKASGQTLQMSEIGLYTVKGDKIVEERFFYAM